jgi:hypothetical protein
MGINARGIVTNNLSIQSSDGLELCPYPGRRALSTSWLTDHSAYYWRILNAIRWADVIHYHFGGAQALPGGRDVAWARMLKKVRVITFWGTDIRVPEIASQDNPYYAQAYRDPAFEYAGRSSAKASGEIQRYYAENGFSCVIGSESMMPHINRKLFSQFDLVRAFIDLRDFPICYPSAGRKRALVFHSPSAPVTKGTPSVIEAAKVLKNRGFEFELVLNENRPRAELMEALKDADIVLDQFVIGGYGVAAIEAMAMGKPVVCYISPSCQTLYPPDLPIVNANQENLADVLEPLLADGCRRHELGVKGRAFVEKYHDSKANVRQLLSIYSRIARDHSQKVSR